MPPTSPLPVSEQIAGLILLELLSDLFTATPRETFTRDEVLVLLNQMKSDPDFFDPDVTAQFSELCKEIDSTVVRLEMFPPRNSPAPPAN